MKHVRVSVDLETLTQLDRIGKPLGLKRSEIVRQALREWLRRQAVERFEEDWITALRRNPDKGERADAWRDIQNWSAK